MVDKKRVGPVEEKLDAILNWIAMEQQQEGGERLYRALIDSPVLAGHPCTIVSHIKEVEIAQRTSLKKWLAHHPKARHVLGTHLGITERQLRTQLPNIDRTRAAKRGGS